MKKLYIFLSILLFSLSALALTPSWKNEIPTNETQYEATQYVQGWAARCSGYDAYGNAVVGYAYGYATKKQALRAAYLRWVQYGGSGVYKYKYWYNY